MSTLIVLGYPSEAEAKSAYQKILDLDKNLIVSLQSVAVVARRADGKYDVVTPGSKVGTSAVWGLFWGVLFGLLFFVPIVGAALGAGPGLFLFKPSLGLFSLLLHGLNVIEELPAAKVQRRIILPSLGPNQGSIRFTPTM